MSEVIVSQFRGHSCTGQRSWFRRSYGKILEEIRGHDFPGDQSCNHEASWWCALCHFSSMVVSPPLIISVTLMWE